MEVFGINTNSGSYHPNFNFGDISHLSYGLKFGDIILLILCFFLLLGILGISSGFKKEDKKENSNEKNSSGLTRTGRNHWESK